MQTEKVDVPRAVGAGLAAGSAYLAAMWADGKLNSHPFNDLKLVGQLFTTRSPWWQLQGLAGHYGFSVVMALVYARWARAALPGPGWLKGVLFLMLENVVLYPLGVPADLYHAGVRAGEVPRIMTWKTFWGQVVRHLAFGVVLGSVYGARPRT